MNYTVLEKSGSDASYDLIIEAIEPKPDNGYIVKSVVATNNKIIEDMINNMLNFEFLQGISWGLRFNFFQHIPDQWILEARLESLFEKMTKKEMSINR
ncbi:hypothetical protein B0P06_000189 [Clostridium saccharoperbutylacetonicum]|uniref:Uncharacterized protein n=1 Tax=Clostridium saccharoperbutylacetonicum N1-4(HMT) TaxID=931276 RepID=M1MLQ0_9CLOT|nr:MULTISPECIES: hypothetical protein [Clostridium]AGF55701.1 hypothetical protein Cspa_c19330 [Clostridium saccharoperbutylacetonicum N1-4(HMT)]NRT63571.1 hypothetical protein [Clostridium saccharoperbutylacetonicum]NSB26934.1 hypothetical protein [Clostridium saccharoperbutylacetonicum]NSB30242.1 hypothetical protein [Clostridium saccharoperbutylacetonicum]NSB40418.1 hypothetical protein [Clostridium saccharoperbutylacetonicum]